jgi:formylglycine-generating enzyme required for sulfatase activity
MMGCSPGDSECAPQETPHQVTITRTFWIGQTEVTQEAFRRVTATNPSAFNGDRLPVDSVNWSDAQAYCKAVGMRLPTEAEWEYAARAGNPSVRYGDLNFVSWYNANSDGKTHPVGQKRPNDFGLYDMLGNVFEWASDWYSPSYYASSPASDPQGPAEGRYRVLRGGSRQHNAMNSRASHRGWYVPGVSNLSTSGVRCAGN